MVWDLDPAIFKLGWYELRYYSLWFAAGFVIGYYLLSKIYAWEKKPLELMDSALVHMVLGTIIGARLGHVIFYSPHWLWEDPLQVLKVWEGGLASHGGLIGILVASFIYSLRYPQINYLWFLDRVSIPSALAGSFIRIGNFFNSEIIGKPTDSSFSVVFARVDDLARYPAQLFESIGYFVIFLILLFTYLPRKEKTPRGLLAGLFLVLIFAWRFFIEFFKERQEAFEEGWFLDMGQILSIPVIIIGLVLIVYSLKPKKS